jgi:anaerobic selenocysteine-containing dehydrogenase
VEIGSYVREDSREKFREGKLRRDGEPGFNTPSGKIEFASRKLADYGYDPLPDFVEPPVSPYSAPDTAKDYPFILVSGTRSVEFYSTLGIEIPRLRKRRPWPTLEMAPEAAAAAGVTEDDWVRIESPETGHAIVRKVAGMDRRVVNAEGLWTMPGEDPVDGALKVGANVLTPLRDDLDPIMGGSVARCILCKFEKLDASPVRMAAE